MNAARHQRISDIFLAAARIEQSRRGELLDSACGEDFELRREVESLLSHHDESTDALDTPVLGDRLRLADLAADEERQPSEAQPPSRIGRYQIVQVVGEGGMGVVYIAQQDKPNRTVALKVIRPGLTSERALRRFEHESHVLGRLQHPGIAQIYEAGTAELPSLLGPRTQPYFAMEYVRGRPLMEHVTAAAMKVPARLALFIEICQAVHHAHQHGVVHRDLKPSNILVDEQGRPKILDFGVARSTDADIQSTTLQTDIGQLIGTIPYMSPEQASGDATRVDARSDVYSLGVILYELLTGRLPHDLRDKTIPEAVHVLTHEDPTPLSAVDRALRGDLNTIAAKALERDPARRYQSASELALDVQRYLDDQPIIARPASAMYQLRKFTRRNKALVGGAAVAVMLLVAGLVATSLLLARAVDAEGLATQRLAQARDAETLALDRLHRAEEAESLANKRLDQAERSAAQKAAVNDFMQRMLTSADPAKRSGQYTVVQMLDDAAAELLSGSLATQPEVEAAIRASIADAYRTLGRYELAQSHATRAIELYRALGDEHRADVGAVLNILGLVRQEQGWLEDSLRLHQEALAVNEVVYGSDHRETATTLNNIGLTLGYMGRFDEAVESYRRALEIRRKVYGGDHEDVAQSLANLASLLRGRGRLDEAEKFGIEAVEMSRRVHGPEHQFLAHCLNTLASIRSTQGRRADAESLLREALAMRRKLLGEHPETAVNLNDLALCIKDQGRLDEAEPLYLESLAMRRKLLDADNPAIAQSLGNLASLKRAQGKLDEAEAMARESLELRRRRLPDDNPDVLAGMNTLALILQEARKTDEAEALLRQVLEARQRVLGLDHSDVAVSMINLAATLRDRGQFDQAEQLARQGLAIQQKVYGPSHPLVASTLYTLSRITIAQQRLDEALEQARQALDMRRQILRPGHSDTARSMVQVASIMLQRDPDSPEQAAQAEALIAPSIDVLGTSLGPHHAQVEYARSLLGESLSCQNRFDEAEPLIVSSFQSLRAGPRDGGRLAVEAAARAVRLYERWSRPDQAEQWRQTLASLQAGAAAVGQ